MFYGGDPVRRAHLENKNLPIWMPKIMQKIYVIMDVEYWNTENLSILCLISCDCFRSTGFWATHRQKPVLLKQSHDTIHITTINVAAILVEGSKLHKMTGGQTRE